MGDVGLLDYEEASEWIRCLYVNGYGRVCLALDDRDVLKIWSELELAAQANASGIMLSKLALASNSYELLKKSAEKISQALSKLSRDNEGFAHDVPESDDGGSKNIGPANSSSKRWIVHNEVLTAHRPGPARLGKFVLHCSSHYVLLMTPRTRIIPPPLICAHETHQFSDPEWCNLKEDESRVLLMPIGTSPVLEFSGTTAVLLRTGRAFEVLCYENIPPDYHLPAAHCCRRHRLGVCSTPSGDLYYKRTFELQSPSEGLVKEGHRDSAFASGRP
jgi:hypothetical protein